MKSEKREVGKSHFSIAALLKIGEFVIVDKMGKLSRKVFVGVSVLLLLAPLLKATLSIRVWAEDEQQEAVDCFDYYQFQKIDISLSSTGRSVTEVLPGERLSLAGTIENKTQVTIPQGQIKYRLVKLTEDEEVRRTQGDQIFDEGVLLSGINLLPGEKKDIKATYQLPKVLVGGEYRLNFFFVQNNQFNWAGLYFTDDIIGSFLPLTVKGSAGLLPFFDRGKTEVNGRKHNHIGFISDPFKVGEQIEFKTVLVNPMVSTVTGMVTTKLYYWDQQDPRRLLDTRRNQVTLMPLEEKPLVYTIAQAKETVYLLEQTFNTVTKPGDLRASTSGGPLRETPDVLGYKNIIFTRIGTNGAKGRINSLGLSRFPVEEGEMITFYVCYHNTSDSSVFQGKVRAELRDGQDNFLGSLEYGGDIPGPLQAIKKDIIFNDTPSKLILSAQIFDKDGRLVDKANIKYDCSKFESRCPTKKQVAAEKPQRKVGYQSYFLAIVIFISSIFFTAVYIVRRRKARR